MCVAEVAGRMKRRVRGLCDEYIGWGGGVGRVCDGVFVLRCEMWWVYGGGGGVSGGVKCNTPVCVWHTRAQHAEDNVAVGGVNAHVCLFW